VSDKKLNPKLDKLAQIQEDSKKNREEMSNQAKLNDKKDSDNDSDE